MSTLTGNKISLTYKSLFKTADNDVLTATLKQMSDGLGNNSGVYLNTGGDLKSTGTLEFANFKGTSTAVTINKLVNEADGISNNDNDTSLPTSAAVKDYVDTHVTTQDLDFSDGTNPGAVDLDSQVFAIVGTSNEIETSASGQQLQIGLPDDVTISGTYTGATFSGDLSGTINTATTATTQTAGNNSTKVATTAYVDTLDAASDLDFSGDSGTGDVNLNTESLAVTGTANQITTAASNQGLEISLLSTGVTMPDGSVATTQTAGDNSTKLATTAYVDTLDAASDLDITDGTNTSDINLNTESLSILGTANEIVSTVSAQTATISLPSTINVNVTGNVTGDLTGNADTATAWQTARDLSLTSEATGTISSVDGSGNVSGAVTLLNSAVTAKVLTGLPTPAAGNIEPSDTILEAFGKVQSQINSISSGLVFKGSWDAATNTPTLTSGGGEVDSGTTDGATTAFKLIDSSQNFNTTVSVGNKVINQVDGQTALVTVIDSNTQLTLDADIMLTAEAYTIDASPFISQGQYYVVNFAGTTNLNGINNWSIGDWVIADANNEWSKLDHSQIDGQGTTGNLPVFTTANTIGDSIVSESGTALTVTGSLTTTLGLSSTGDFAVNTDKFTVNATSGNVTSAGNIIIDSGFKYQIASLAEFKHSGSNGFITTFTGDLNLRSVADIYISPNNSEDGLKVIANGAVELYYDNVKKFETTSTGVSVTGSITSGAHLINASSSAFGGSSVQGVNTDFLIDTGQGYARFNSYYTGGGNIQFLTNAASSTTNSVALTLDSSQNATFAGTIASNNIAITNSGNGELSVTRTSGATVKSIAQSARGQIGTSSNHELQLITNATSRLTIDTSGNSTFAGSVNAGAGLQMYTDGSGNGVIFNTGQNKDLYLVVDDNGTGVNALVFDGSENGAATFAGDIIGSASILNIKNNDIRFKTTGDETMLRAVANGAVELMYDNSTKLTTTSTGVSVTGSITSGALSVGSSGTSRFTDTNAFPLQLNRGLDVDVYGANGCILGIGSLKGSTYIDGTRISGGIETNGTDGSFIVQTLGGGSYTTALTINSSQNSTFAGNVGIGGSPNVRLGLSNSTALTAVYQQFTNGTTGTAASDGTVMGIDSDGDFLINNQEAKEIKLYTSDALRLIIDSTGKVGIGTDSPTAKIMIETGSDEGIRIYRAGTNANFGAIEFRNSDDTATNSRIGFGTDYMRIEGTNNLQFVTNSAERMRITSGGAISLPNNNTAVIGRPYSSGTINNGQSVGVNLNSAGGNQAGGFLVISAVPNNVNAGGAVEIWTHLHTQGANVYSKLSGQEENSITISESGGAFTISNSSGSTVYYNVKVLNLTDFASTIAGT